jgi:hypothetical protein
MKILKLISYLLLLTTFICKADFPYLSIEQRVENASLIVIGKIVSFESIKIYDELHPRKVAVVKIKTLVKGKLASEFLLASVGFYWPNNIKSSQDMDLKLYDEGKWLLNKDKSGLFMLTRPDNFIKLIK